MGFPVTQGGTVMPHNAFNSPDGIHGLNWIGSKLYDFLSIPLMGF